MGFPIFNLSEYASIIKSLSIPNEVHEFVWDMDLENLKEKGFDTIVLDVDNTILSNHQRNLSLQHLNWVQTCKEYGFEVIILSNNRSRRRVKRVLDQIQCNGMFMACKPFTFCIHYLARKYNVELQSSVVIGDQVLKDVIVGNWLKIHTILVKPLDLKQSFFFRLQKEFEEFILNKYS